MERVFFGMLSLTVCSLTFTSVTLHLVTTSRPPRRILQNPRHRRWTPAEETWRRTDKKRRRRRRRRKRRRSRVQAAGTSLRRASRGREEKWGRGEWKCGKGEGGERGGRDGSEDRKRWMREETDENKHKEMGKERKTGSTDGKLQQVWQERKRLWQ